MRALPIVRDAAGRKWRRWGLSDLNWTGTCCPRDCNGRCLPWMNIRVLTTGGARLQMQGHDMFGMSTFDIQHYDSFALALRAAGRVKA
jgi:hypothetical protein